jgi:Fur family transcriptional regulator, ferric uptake regulator
VSDPNLRAARSTSQPAVQGGTNERLNMSVPHEARPLTPPSVPAAITTLRVRGLRVSAARRLVLEALFAADGPVTAEVIAGGLDGRFPPSDLASVYRNLDTLEQLGMVRHFHVAHGAGRYTLATRHRAGYAACEGCGALTALDPDTVARLAGVLGEACGFSPRLVHFPIVGCCPECDDARP